MMMMMGMGTRRGPLIKRIKRINKINKIYDKKL